MDSNSDEDDSQLCSFCGKQFIRTSSLKKHKRLCKLNSDKYVSVNSICTYCGKGFAQNSSLFRHEKICSNGPTECKFKCPICFTEFSRVANFDKHRRDCETTQKDSGNAACKSCHQLFSNVAELESHTCISKKRHLLSKCLFENCKMTFYRRRQLVCHLRKVHGSSIDDEQTFVFDNADKFLEWKLGEEQATFSYFTKRSGTRGNIDYYYCQLDGSSKPHCKTGAPARKTARRVKKGTTKNDKVCLAKIKVKIENDGRRSVVYQPMHSHKLKEKESDIFDTVTYINKQLSMEVSRENYFQSIMEVEPNQMSLEPILVSGAKTLTCKRMKIRNNRDDAISVLIRIALLSREQCNPVILYKPLGEDKAIGPKRTDKLINSIDLFVLGIQTKEQKLVMNKDRDAVLSVSWTNDTNTYGYYLVTFVIRDKHNMGYPVAYFIINQFDVETLSACFIAFLDNCGPLTHAVFIIPDDMVVLEALHSSFGKNVMYVLCLSSVRKIFQQSLDTMVLVNLKLEIYDSLCHIIECCDETSVHNLIDSFIKIYSATSALFVSFLKSNYLNRVAVWTKAYRKSLPPNTDTSFNECLHNRIKSDDVCESTCRRLDGLINILLSIEEDDYMLKYMEDIIGIPLGIGKIHDRHLEAARIGDDCISQVHSNVWEISSDNLEKRYEIVRHSSTCTNDLCYFICNSVGCSNLCSHLFSCSCEDINPLCVHIHKLHMNLCHYEDVITDANLSKQVDKTKTHLIGFVDNRLQETLSKCKTEVQTEGYRTEDNTIKNPMSFTPSLNYADLNRTVLKIETEELSFLDLKSLDPHLTNDETEVIQEYSRYRNSYLSANIINAYLLQLKSLYKQIIPIHTDVSLVLQRKGRTKTWSIKDGLEKDTFIMPMNVDDFWTCLAVSIKSKSIVYFSLLGNISKKENIIIKKFLKSITEDIRWNISVTNFNNVSLEDDKLGYGIHVCHFAEQIAKQVKVTPLFDILTYRQHIYDTIVGECLKGSTFGDFCCGKCASCESPDVSDDTADVSICCTKCSRWYHNSCVGVLEINVYQTPFTCPQ